VGTEPTVCTELCGDGLRVGDELVAGHCDDDNTTAGDGCSAVCVEELGFDCVGTPSVCDEVCGDGLVVGVEVCDGSNLDGLTDCTGLGYVNAGTLTCLANCSDYDTAGCAPSCGNGAVEPGETCDDGGTANGDGCSSACAEETGWDCIGAPSVCNAVCGDLFVVPGEEVCDGSNLNSKTCTTEGNYFNPNGLLCLSTCQGFNLTGCAASCGNRLEPGEACDDGNTTPGDGCSATCTIETDWTCSGVIPNTSVCTCSSTNACPIGRICNAGACIGVNGDNCSGTYAAEPIDADPTSVDITRDNTHLATTITTYMVSGSPVAVNGPDMFFSISVTDGQYLIVELTDNTEDFSIALLGACPTTSTATPLKFSNRNGVGAMEQLHYEATSTKTYYIVVQGLTALDQGSFRLRVYQGNVTTSFDKNQNVVITEIMANPVAGADGYKEWIELKNVHSGRNYNLNGAAMDLNGTKYAINEDVILRYNDTVHFAGSTNMSLNGGFDTVIWAWNAQDVIPDTAGTVQTRKNATDTDTCDAVTYTASWPIVEGASISLDPDFTTRTDNNNAANWCTANNDGTPPDMTPWYDNEQCP